MTHSARQLWLLTAISTAMMAVGLIWALFEARQFQDSLVWIKPFKFALSLSVFFATLALAFDRLSDGVQRQSKWRIVIAVLAAAFWLEMLYISAQAALGTASHFSVDTPFHGIMYSLMGVGAASLVAGTALIGWAVLRDGASTLGGDLRFGIGVGFILSTVLTLITAFTLGGNGGHFVGVPPAGAAVIPFFGWSAAVGDLRPSHFVALHAMQAIPLLAWAVAGRASARAWIIGGSVGYSALTLALYAQALMSLPLIRL
jgi:hypothetical protein